MDAVQIVKAKDMTQKTNGAVAIFVKTPSLSPIKTRLAEGVGENAALEFYHLSLKAVEQTVRCSGVEAYWAVAETEGLEYPLWSNLTTLHSGEGDLGARQWHVYETLRREYKNIILIGADAPQLSPDIIERAIAALDEHDFVISPARDGGYTLFGGCAEVAKDVWGQVPWSAENTREVFESLLPSKPSHLPAFTDVDVQEDLQAVLVEMPDIVSEQQQALIDWVVNL